MVLERRPSDLGGAEFSEHAEGELRVEEGDEFTRGALEGHLVDQFDAGAGGLGELTGDVGRGEGDVVHAARGIFFEKFGDRALGRGRLKELDMRLPGAEEGGAHLLRRDFFAVLALQAERLLIVRDRFVERTNRDAQVIDFCDHIGCGVLSAAGCGCSHISTMPEGGGASFAWVVGLRSFLGNICAARNSVSR